MRSMLLIWSLMEMQKRLVLDAVGSRSGEILKIYVTLTTPLSKSSDGEKYRV